MGNNTALLAEFLRGMQRLAANDVCPVCGEQHETFCPDCGKEYKDADTYCLRCGHIRPNGGKKAY